MSLGGDISCDTGVWRERKKPAAKGGGGGGGWGGGGGGWGAGGGGPLEGGGAGRGRGGAGGGAGGRGGGLWSGHYLTGRLVSEMVMNRSRLKIKDKDQNSDHYSQDLSEAKKRRPEERIHASVNRKS